MVLDYEVSVIRIWISIENEIIIFIILGIVLWGCYFLFGASIVGLSILNS